MVVTRSGKMAGSVSNGCIEGAVFDEAQKVLKSRKPKVAAFGVADDVAFEVGLACGGDIAGVVAPPGPGRAPPTSLPQPPTQAPLRPHPLPGATGQSPGGAPPRSHPPPPDLD